MAVAGRYHRDTGIEIEETISVNILNDRAFSAARHQRVRTRVRGRQNLCVPIDDLPGTRTRNRPAQARHIRTDGIQSAFHSNPPVLESTLLANTDERRWRVANRNRTGRGGL